MILVDRSRKQILLQRSLVMAITFAVLLVPATCSHSAGPHSIYIDPREAPADQHGHHRTPAHEAAAHDGSSTRANSHEPGPTPAGRVTMSDLPSTMWITIASSTMLLLIPHDMTIPTVSSPESPRAERAHRETLVPVDVPPPRAGMLVAFEA